jgi:hypothetical protein
MIARDNLPIGEYGGGEILATRIELQSIVAVHAAEIDSWL